MERRSSSQNSGDQNSSFVMMLLLVSGFVALIGLIYVYGDFSQRKSEQIAGVVRVNRPSEASDSAPLLAEAQAQAAEEAAGPLPLDGTEVDPDQSEPVIQATEEAKVEETAQPEPVAVQPPVQEEKKEPAKPVKKTRKTKVFFVRATDTGYLSLKETAVEIDDRRAPLTTAIQSLLKGPEEKERGQGLHSLIPEGSKLLTASVKGGVAYLDFNESFRFNSLGTDGYQAQLQQIIYTATEFPSVKSVQILLEGKPVDYLHEGIYVGEPLTRESFRK